MLCFYLLHCRDSYDACIDIGTGLLCYIFIHSFHLLLLTSKFLFYGVTFFRFLYMVAYVFARNSNSIDGIFFYIALRQKLVFLQV